MALETESVTLKEPVVINALRTQLAKPKVTGTVCAVENLSTLQIERMFQLMQMYYENVSMEQFKTDLLEKDHVILLQDKCNKTIQGFSTLLQVPLTVGGRNVLGVYSGDTVLNKSYWGTAALGITFLKYLWQLKVMNLTKPVYWFLISKGYKTYLIMANNFTTHYPRYEAETPSYYKQVMKAFYAKKFGQSYISDSDLIKFNTPSCHLRENVAAIKESQLRIPRVKFFQDKNPDWQNGDELTCIAEMTFFMPLTYAIKKLLKGIFR
jgi:hypothetical protein